MANVLRAGRRLIISVKVVIAVSGKKVVLALPISEIF